jgi:hypothetical protein
VKRKRQIPSSFLVVKMGKNQFGKGLGKGKRKNIFY